MQVAEQIRQSYEEQPHWLVRYWWLWICSYVVPFTIASNLVFWWVMDNYYDASKQPGWGSDETTHAAAWLAFWSVGQWAALRGLVLALVVASIVHFIKMRISKSR